MKDNDFYKDCLEKCIAEYGRGPDFVTCLIECGAAMPEETPVKKATFTTPMADSTGSSRLSYNACTYTAWFPPALVVCMYLATLGRRSLDLTLDKMKPIIEDIDFKLPVMPVEPTFSIYALGL